MDYLVLLVESDFLRFFGNEKMSQSETLLLTSDIMLIVMLRKVKCANDADTKRQRSVAAFGSVRCIFKVNVDGK